MVPGVYIGLYWDNGKETGNDYSITGYIGGYVGVVYTPITENQIENINQDDMETAIQGFGKV